MTTTSDARKRRAEAQGPHAGCVPGQCRVGDQWRTTGCRHPEDAALTDAERDALEAAYIGGGVPGLFKAVDLVLAARSQRPEAGDPS